MAKTKVGDPRSEPRPIPHRTLHCQLFQHQKHSDACIVLRAKGVCRSQCGEFFNFANEHKEAVANIISKHLPAITDHRRRHKLNPDENLLAYVMPKGECICKHCGKSFVQEVRLDKHIKQKHKRSESELAHGTNERVTIRRRNSKEVPSDLTGAPLPVLLSGCDDSGGSKRKASERRVSA